MKYGRAIGFVIRYALIGLLLGSSYLYWHDYYQGKSRDSLTVEGPEPATPVFSYADAVTSSAASVVSIYTSKTITEKSHPLLNDPVFGRFFGEQLQQRQRSRTETNLGSGVIIGTEGYILTNQHVIDGADEILIALADGRGSKALLIGQDQETDIAILQIPVSDLSGIKIAASKTLNVGDVVLAIGNPLNVGQTVTMGIVSATGRNRVGLNTFENFIQTDAAINPGNSGGALVNAHGELIGINTAIFSQSVGAQGIGFAIPISLALDIMQQIIEHGRVSRGWLGVEGSELTAQAAISTNNPGIRGVLIVGIFIDSPADMAGLRRGDIVVAVNHQPVSSIRDLLDQIIQFKPGQTIMLELYRGPKRMHLEMEVAERPPIPG